MIFSVISFDASISACEKCGQWQHAWSLVVVVIVVVVVVYIFI